MARKTLRAQARGIILGLFARGRAARSQQPYKIVSLTPKVTHVHVSMSCDACGLEYPSSSFEEAPLMWKMWGESLASRGRLLKSQMKFLVCFDLETCKGRVEDLEMVCEFREAVKT